MKRPGPRLLKFDHGTLRTQRRRARAAADALLRIAGTTDPGVVMPLAAAAMRRIDPHAEVTAAALPPRAEAAPVGPSDAAIISGLKHLIAATRGSAVQRTVLRALDKLPVPAAAAVARVHPNTIRRARKQPLHLMPYISRRYAFVTKRPRISKAEHQALREWIITECPARSGSKSGAPRQHCTSDFFYKQYRQAYPRIRERALAITTAAGEHLRMPLRPRCAATLRHAKIAAKVHVATGYHGQFNCTSCAAYTEAVRWVATCEAEAKGSSPAETKRKEAKLSRAQMVLARLQRHRRARDHQREWDRNVRTSLLPGELLLHMDFTSVDTKPNRCEQKDESGKEIPTKCWDLVMTVEWRGSDGTPQRKYYDFLSTDPGEGKNDVWYVRTALLTCMAKGIFTGFTKIHLFTDGGPKHFKCVYAMQMASEWARDWRTIHGDRKDAPAAPALEWNFYAAHHGYSLCDSHAGVVKRCLTHAQRNAQHAAGGTYGIGQVPVTTAELANVLNTRCKRTEAVEMPAIQRPATRTPLQRIMADGKGITSYYQFAFDGTIGKLRCRTLSDTGTWHDVDIKKKQTWAAAAAAAAQPRAKSVRKRKQSARALIDGDDVDYNPKVHE